MKSDFSLLNQTVISQLAFINKLEIQVGQISTHLYASLKEGLPSDTVVKHKKNAYVMAIDTRSGRNLGENVVEIDEKSLVEQESAKRKCSNIPSYRAPKSHEVDDE